MDTDNLIKHARARFNHAAARRVLKEKYEAKMTFAYAGGMWRAGPELQTVLLSCPDVQAVILDLYDTPVKVVPGELFAQASQVWQEQMTAWLVEHNDLSRNR